MEDTDNVIFNENKCISLFLKVSIQNHFLWQMPLYAF